MTTPLLPAPIDRRTLFLVERYLPRAAAENLAASVARTARLCALACRPGSERESVAQVRYLSSAYLPTENTCICLFLAQDADAVRSVNDEAGFALDRITAAALLHPLTEAGLESHALS